MVSDFISKEVSGPNGFCHHGRSVEGGEWDRSAASPRLCHGFKLGCPEAIGELMVSSGDTKASSKKGILGGSLHSNSQNMPQIIS